MREFLLNSEELLDRNALDFLKKGEAWGLLPCHQIRFNAKVKLAYFTDGYQCLGEKLPRMTLDEICYVGQKILGRIQNLEGRMEISLENLVWDVDSIYLDSQEQVFCLCLPAVIPEVSLTSQIYLKRVYALLEEMVEHAEGGEEVCRQIEFQKEREFGNWENLKNALVRRVPQEDETLLLKSVNTTEPLAFQIRHRLDALAVLKDVEHAQGVDARHLHRALRFLVEGRRQVGRDGRRVQVALDQQRHDLIRRAIHGKAVVRAVLAVHQVHKAHGGGALQARHAQAAGRRFGAGRRLRRRGRGCTFGSGRRLRRGCGGTAGSQRDAQSRRHDGG